MTREAMSRAEPSPGQPLTDVGRQTATDASGNHLLLYGLSVVTGLPPEAILTPPNGALPEIRSDRPHPVLNATPLEHVLQRPVAHVGHGVVALQQVDWRMHGLIASFAVSRTVDESAMLLCLGLVEHDHMTRRAKDATVQDLWDLVCELLPTQGDVTYAQIGIRRGAVLSWHGGSATQVVWPLRERLVTVTATSLHGGQLTHDAARAVAWDIDHRLTGNEGDGRIAEQTFLGRLLASVPRIW
jgi:hypothetical protein